MIACLAAGPRWRVLALIFSIATLALHAAYGFVSVLMLRGSWIFYTPYSPTSLSLPEETLRTSLADLALPIVLLALLCRKEALAGMRRG
ncbi:MAG TPA: hypothetical protein VFC78_20925 [Tepidisphaeraceae bacterium]|nr:hypothetical protein [Tepidisphaeraceae bacterium]